MFIAFVCIWLWEKIGPDKMSRGTWFRNVVIGNVVVAAVAAYYYNHIWMMALSG